jgi:lipopolysaccharide transport system ATP-binding protein
MSDIAIQVEHLSKMYQIGHNQQRHDTLRDLLVDIINQSFKRNGKHHNHDQFMALKDVSFEVKRGEVLGIIGRNGAGKSTLLKILSRITEPTGGRAVINGRVGSLLEVGTGFHPELTGRENIYLNGSILGMRRVEIGRKFDEIVDFAEIEKFLDTPVKRYSSGMYVRLAFAVAAHLEPEILLVDEVLAVGDISFQNKCLGKIGNIAQEGRTILFVSHNLSALQNICNKAIMLSDGSLLEYGNTRSVIESYISKAQETFSNKSIVLNSSKSINGFRFEGLNIKDGKCIPRTIFSNQEEICIEYVINCDESLNGVVLGLTLRTLYGQLVCNLRSEDQGTEFNLKAGRNIIKLYFRLENFLTNVYTVDIGATYNGTQVLGLINNVGQISIVTGDISGFGKTRQTGELVYIPSKWSG